MLETAAREDQSWSKSIVMDDQKHIRLPPMGFYCKIPRSPIVYPSWVHIEMNGYRRIGKVWYFTVFTIWRYRPLQNGYVEMDTSAVLGLESLEHLEKFSLSIWLKQNYRRAFDHERSIVVRELLSLKEENFQ